MNRKLYELIKQELEKISKSNTEIVFNNMQSAEKKLKLFKQNNYQIKGKLKKILKDRNRKIIQSLNK